MNVLVLDPRGEFYRFVLVCAGHDCRRMDSLHGFGDWVPDVVITEVKLKSGNGFRACMELKKLYLGVKVIFLTKSDRKIFRNYAHIVGASSYILKPVGLVQLLSLI